MTFKSRTVLFFLPVVALLFSSCQSSLLGPDDTLQRGTYNTQFEQVLDSIRVKANFPAFAGAIVTTDTILAAAAVGSRRYGGPVNVTIDDQFHLGSCTKALTATLIAVLVNDGLLSWNTTLRDLYPEYADIMRPEYRYVTIRQILSHSAGFYRTPEVEIFPGTATEQRKIIVEKALQRAPAIASGSYLYSNLGYIIAGAIAEKLTGRNYEDLLIDRVLKPLGITSGGFGSMGVPGMEDQPLQHTIYYAPIIPGSSSDLPVCYSPAGRLHLSIRDWAKFVQWVLRFENGTYSLVSKENAKILTQAYVPAEGESYYALGWGVSDQQMAGGRTLSHGGSNGLNLSMAWLAPLRKFAVIGATNICAGTSNKSMNDALIRMINYHDTGI